MPLEVRAHELCADSPTHFAQVLRADTEAAAELQQLAGGATSGWCALEGVFNGRPVALALAQAEQEGWRLHCLVVHPATRNRGVGGEILQAAASRLAPLRIPDSLADLARKTGV